MLVNNITVGVDVYQLFPFPATFTEKFMEVWEWKTDVHSSFNNTEQRECLRENPRMTYEFSAWALRKDAAWFKNLVWSNIGGGWGLPMWHQPQMLSSDLGSGETVITLADTQDFGNYLCFYIDDFNYQFRAITSKTDTTITLTTATNHKFLSGTPVYPVHLARLEESQELKNITGNLLTSYCTFNCFSFANPYKNLVTGDVVYKSLPVLEFVNNWSDGLTDKYELKVSVFDNELSNFIRDLEGASPTITKTFSWFLNGKDNLNYFKAWLAARKGRLTPFWFPSQVRDFTYISHSGFELIVDFCGYSYLTLENSPREIRIEFMDGTVEYRHIESVVKVGETEELTVDVTLPVGDVRMISYLYLSRLDADRVEMVYQTNRFATASTPIRSLVYGE